LVSFRGLHVSAIVPARNEVGAIAYVVEELLTLRDDAQKPVIDEVLVVDNASSDGTAAAATTAGAKVVHQTTGAYGAACLAGVAAIRHTDIVLFVDGDASCIISESAVLLQSIADGSDLAIGVRTIDRREAGAMTWTQRAGTALAAYLIRVLWQRPCSDLGPFRAIRWTALQRLEMQDQRFGWTAEMQIKAILHNLVIQELPVSVRRRIGKSKISGTILGTYRAGRDILTTIFRLHRQRKPWLRGETPRIAH
jgi:hypothetical protein